jgi:hypothetical protein
MAPPQRKQRVAPAEAEAPGPEAVDDEEALGAIPDLMRRAVAMGLTGFLPPKRPCAADLASQG